MPRPSLASILSEKPSPAVVPTKYEQDSDVDASDDPWREKFKRHWAQFEMFAFPMLMADKIQKQNKIVRDTVRRVQNGTVGKPDPSIDDAEREDDMGFSIGDTVTHVYPQKSPSGPTIPGWAKAAALIGSGLVGAAAWNLFGPKSSTPTAPAKVESTPVLNPGGVTIEVVKDPVPK